MSWLLKQWPKHEAWRLPSFARTFGIRQFEELGWMQSVSDDEVVGLLDFDHDALHVPTWSKTCIPGLSVATTCSYLTRQLALANNVEVVPDADRGQASSGVVKVPDDGAPKFPEAPWSLLDKKRPLSPTEPDAEPPAFLSKDLNDGFGSSWDERGKYVGLYADENEGHWVS